METLVLKMKTTMKTLVQKACVALSGVVFAVNASAATWTLDAGVLTDSDTGWSFTVSGAASGLMITGVVASSEEFPELDFTSLDGVQTPYKLTNLGVASFRSNNVITKVTTPVTMTKINLPNTNEGSAFSHCGKLTDVNMPGVTYVGWRAFQYCPNLVNVSMPAVGLQLHDQAFLNCTSLVNIDIPNVASLGSSALNGTLFGGDHEFAYLTSLSSGFSGSRVTGLKLPKLVNTNVNYPLSNVKFLEWCEVPRAQILGQWAMENNSAMTDVLLPSVTKIRICTFNNCTSLTNIVMPRLAQIDGLGGWSPSFNNCASLKEFKFAQHMTTNFFRGGVFTKCPALETIGVHKSSPLWQYMNESEEHYTEITNALVQKSTATGAAVSPLVNVVCYGGDETIESEKWIYDDLMADGSVKILAVTDAAGGASVASEVEIPAKLADKRVRSIECGAFMRMTGLRKVRIPKSVTSVGKYAFMDCTEGLVVEVFNQSVALIDALREEYGELITVKPYAGAGLKIIVR